jgi:hypothetical protein
MTIKTSLEELDDTTFCTLGKTAGAGDRVRFVLKHT